MAFPRRSLSPVQLATLLAAEREGTPFVALVDGTAELRIVSLDGCDRLTIGRAPHNGVPLPWDAEVSRVHAQLELVGDEWILVDDGLSRNGSYVNDERAGGRHRLEDGDTVLIGRTPLLFRWPGRDSEATITASPRAIVRLTDAQRRVLVALVGDGGPPATNRQIAEALHLSIDGVKTHIRTLFEKFAVEDLPQYSKRTELARRAVQLGVVDQ